MIGTARKDKERERFYLFAGMGGRAFRRKSLMFLAWALAAGTLVSVLLGLGLYLINRRW